MECEVDHEPRFRLGHRLGHRIISASLRLMRRIMVQALALSILACPGMTLAQDFEGYGVEVNGQAIYAEVPSDLATVYGVVINIAVGDHGVRDFARTLGFASVTFGGTPRPEGIAGVGGETQIAFDLLEGIAMIAAEAGHPEMANAPILWFGFSDGGSSGNAMTSVVPERMIAVANNDGLINVYETHSVPVTDSVRATPFYFCNREDTDGWRGFVERERANGALWAEGFIHTRTSHQDGQRCWPMLYYFLSQVVALRYPVNVTPVASSDVRTSSVSLLSIDESAGYLASHAKRETYPLATPIAEYSGDTAEASWLANANLAAAHRATAGWNRQGPLQPFREEILHLAVDEAVTWDIVEPSAEWTEIRVMDGAQVLAVFRPGDSLTFQGSFGTAEIGTHFLYLEASVAGGTLTSPPSAWFVRGLGVPWGTDVPPTGDAGPGRDAGSGRDSGPGSDVGRGVRDGGTDGGLPRNDGSCAGAGSTRAPGTWLFAVLGIALFRRSSRAR